MGMTLLPKSLRRRLVTSADQETFFAGSNQVELTSSYSANDKIKEKGRLNAAFFLRAPKEKYGPRITK